MEITVSENAQDFVRQKGGAFYIDDGRMASLCCGCLNLGPPAEMGLPPKSQPFQLKILGGIQMYVPQGFSAPYPLTIVVRQFLGHRYLAIEGWKLI